ncbi:MerR family transcriptional regulator [Salinithrix halophila]|uniref:MerR family transcriptional regulator n=1 Tax=Salinithrix halophila TaxID=1485204 RepID=UPI0036D3E234
MGEAAKRLGLTVRTLHHYDEIGLVGPAERNQHGHRLYTQEDLMKLAQVKMLKRVGLPLKDIRAVLDHHRKDPDQLLKKQLSALRQEKNRLEEMEKGLISILRSVEVEGGWDWKIVNQFIRLSEVDDDERDRHLRKWFTEEEQVRLRRLPVLEDHSAETEEWIHLLRILADHRDQGPASPIVQEVIARIDEKTRDIFEGDEAMMNRFWEVRKDPEQSEKLRLYPIDENMLEFLEEASLIYERYQKGE